MPKDASKTEPNAESKRRWFRYSLRTLFLLMTMICIVAAWTTWKLVPSMQQKHAIDSLRGNGTILTFQYDYQVPYYDGKMKGQPPPEPGSLAKLVGVDLTHDVTKVQLLERSFQTPEDFQQAVSSLRWLPHLRFLQIYSPHRGDLDLKPLARLKDLEQLHLDEDRLDDSAMKYLSKLNHLWNLTLGSGQISDDGLVSVANLKNLKELTVYENQLTDVGLARLANLTGLEQLILAKNQITGSGLGHLANLTKLYDLTLDDNPITDEGLKTLPALPGLSFLSLVRTNVTDASIQVLGKLPADREISISIAGSKISSEGAAKLHKLLPRSTIWIQGSGFNDTSNATEVFLPPGSDDPVVVSPAAN